MTRKICPVVLRLRGGVEVLAFRHPQAGLQLVKGTIEAGESDEQAAMRELFEEAGIAGSRVTGRYGSVEIGENEWVFLRMQTPELDERWVHRCADDGGLDFAFFWHRVAEGTNEDWHHDFREALRFVSQAVDEVAL